MDCNADRLAAVLDKHGDAALHAVLLRREIGGRCLFLIGEQIYPLEGALRETLGGGFEFENEKARARLSSWLEMIGAASGDTMLHLLLRINGADEQQKVACAVQLLGRGVDWEKANEDQALPSMVDVDVFKEAFFRALPRWKAAEKQRRRQEQQEKAERAGVEAVRRKKEDAVRDAARRKANWAAVREKAAEEVKREHDRDRFHVRLQNALEKMDVREGRAKRKASEHPAAELVSSLSVQVGRAERWLRDQVCARAPSSPGARTKK